MVQQSHCPEKGTQYVSGNIGTEEALVKVQGGEGYT